MTVDLLLAGIKAWIESMAGGGSMEGVPVLLAGDADEKSPPLVGIVDTGSEEHPILRGVLTITVELRLTTVPVDETDEEDESGTTPAEHREMAADLYGIIADTAMIAFLAARPGLNCFDIRDVRPTTESDSDMRITTFQLSAVACLR